MRIFPFLALLATLPAIAAFTRSIDKDPGDSEASAWMGERDLAFAWLQKAVERERLQPSAMMNPLHLMSPVFRNLHGDVRWDEILESNGYSPARLDAIEFDPEMPQ